MIPAIFVALVNSAGIPPHLRQASKTEMLAGLFESQISSKDTTSLQPLLEKRETDSDSKLCLNGVVCDNLFKHSCIGHSRTCIFKSPPNARQRASWVPIGADLSTTLEGLGILADEIRRRGLAAGLDMPDLLIVGDSLSADFWTATVMGLRRLGYRLLINDTAFLCDCVRYTGGPRYLGSETVLAARCANRPKTETSRRTHAILSDKHAGSFGVRFVRYDPQSGGTYDTKLNANAVVIVMSQGAHYNSKIEFSGALPKIKGVIGSMIDSPANPRILWVESLPQHFATKTGAFEKSAGTRKCESLRGKPVQWRNAFVAQWLSAHNTSALHRKVTLVSAYDAFADREDLHADGDCTHYLYTPFTWRYVWDDIARKL